jgi:enoyl-CoA hydratase
VPLRTVRSGRVAVLVLDDPERRNALTRELIQDIVRHVNIFETSDDVGALVITGAPPAFCAGADVSGLAALVGAGGKGAQALRDIYGAFLRVRSSPLPTVAAVNGPAVGAGVNLALACDVRIATPEARFDSRFVSIGLHPGGGHTWLLERAIGPQAAAAMALFGQSVDGDRAVELGLAWQCVPEDGLLDTAVALAAHAAEAPPDLNARVKTSLRNAPWRATFDDAVTAELGPQLWSLDQPFFKPHREAASD